MRHLRAAQRIGYNTRQTMTQTLFTYAQAKPLAVAADALLAVLALRWAWRVVCAEERRLGLARFLFGAAISLLVVCHVGGKTNSPPRSAAGGDACSPSQPLRSHNLPILYSIPDAGSLPTNFPPVTNLCFFGLWKGTNSVDIGLAWPFGFPFTNGVADIYAIPELATNRWHRLAGVDVSAAASNVVAELPFSLFPTNSMESRAFFRAATQHDSDGDGHPDAYEELSLGTDPQTPDLDLMDSDGDGLSDLIEAGTVEFGAELPELVFTDCVTIYDAAASQSLDSVARVHKVPLPFVAMPCGVPCTNASVSTVGVVGFLRAGDDRFGVNPSCVNQDLGDEFCGDLAYEHSAVAAYWDDLYSVHGDGAVICAGEAVSGTCRWFVVEYSGVTLYDRAEDPDPPRGTFRVAVSEADPYTVHVRYDSLTGGFDGSSATIGAQGPYRVRNFPVAYNVQGSVASGTTISYRFGPGSDSHTADTDGDGLPDGTEFAIGTSAVWTDTDGDRLFDGWEILNGFDPTSASGASGRDGDPDGDGVTNEREQALDTDPNNPDSDFDGLSDGAEAGGIVASEGLPWLSFDTCADLTGLMPSYIASHVSWPLSCPVVMCGETVTNAVLGTDGGIWLCRAGYDRQYFVADRVYFLTPEDFSGTLLLGPYAFPGCMRATEPATRIRAGTATHGGAGYLLFEYENLHYAYSGEWETNSLSFQVAVATNGQLAAFVRYRDMRGDCMQGFSASVGFKGFYSRSVAEWSHDELDRVASPMSLAMTIGLGTDPLNPDSDFDGLSDGVEANTIGTHPLDSDSDFDGMADGWESAHGFSPVMDNSLDQDDDNDADADPDHDGLSNADESDHGTDPGEPDTDGDGVSDGTEVAHSGDPSDGSDGGVAGSRAVVHLEFGDWSGSQSEKYALRVCPVGRMPGGPPEGTPPPAAYCWANRSHGVCDTRAAALKPGWIYEVSLAWVSCREPGEGYPDFDYRLRFPPGLPCPASVVLEDPQGLFQESAHVSAYCFPAAGKTARLHVIGPPEVSAPSTVGVNDDDDDGDGTPDWMQQGTAAGEDDLAEVTVSAPCPHGASGTVTVTPLSLDGTLWRDRARTESVGFGVADAFHVSSTGGCTRTYYFEGERASARHRTGRIHVDFACGGAAFAADHWITVVDRVAEPVTTARSQGRVANPCCAIAGETVAMRVEVSPQDFPDGDIRWSVVSGSGTFPGGSTGREVEFSAAGDDGDSVVLQVDVGDCPGAAPQFALRVTDMQEVKIYPCVIARKGRQPTVTAARLDAMLDEVNVIFRQVGMHFSLGASIMNVVDDDWAERGLVDASIGAQIRNVRSGTDGLEVYFVPGMNPRKSRINKEPLGEWNDYGIILKDLPNAHTFAHEIGHACGWYDIHIDHAGAYSGELLDDVRLGWLEGDWSGGTGHGFYGVSLTQKDLIKRLLMYGRGSEVKSDIPNGNIYGLDEDGTLGNIVVGAGFIMATQPTSL